ncbi:MAG: hypothetical protein WC318_03525 [Candidatus Omnitrophota bacterium]
MYSRLNINRIKNLYQGKQFSVDQTAKKLGVPFDLKDTMNYWRKVTGIPINQFTKPYVREGNPNLSKRKLPYGLVHIRYNDKRLLETINSWIESYRKVILIRVGTQVAKGGRLCNRSVMPKGVMEK